MFEHHQGKLTKTKIIFCYAMGVVGAAILPVEELVDTGTVDSATLAISAIAFLVGATVVTAVFVLLARRGKIS